MAKHLSGTFAKQILKLCPQIKGFNISPICRSNPLDTKITSAVGSFLPVRNCSTLLLKDKAVLSPCLYNKSLQRKTGPNYIYQANQDRQVSYYLVNRPNPNTEKRNLRFKVHYPEDGIYTVEHLKMSKLGGRDPDTGRIILGCVGGGRKTFYRWVDMKRVGPTEEGKYLEERIIAIEPDPNRSAHIALVGIGDKLRYLIATDNMRKGDLIRSSSYIPDIPVRPRLGDAYPLGALPIGTQICCIELIPGEGTKVMVAAGTSATIASKLGKKRVILLRKKVRFALDPNCMVVVGQVSNPGHKDEHIGSPNRLRWLGRRPRSGLWQRKTGRFGRRIRLPPRIKHFGKKRAQFPTLTLTVRTFGPDKDFHPSTNRVT